MLEFRLYDSMTRQTKELRPIEPGRLRFYSCGPTVYSYAHIGNFRTFLTADLVVRTAEAIGWQVDYVCNITDVGHLTEDDMADAGGEDKMARALQSKEGERFANVWDLAEHYAEAFKEDWTRLGLLEPMVRPKATTHMREQILAVERLIAEGHAYETPTGVYFSVESFVGYGKLSGNTDQDKLMREVRDVVSDDNKRHQADFALWKKDDKHLMQWFSPWGWGFPGWHLECSVMAMGYLGDTLDLHAGGEDLIFPHHECEIAQSESLTGRPFANHWMHTRFLQVDGEKMSKSRGNFYTVRDLVDERGADPIALRYALIAVPYGKPLNFTLQSLRDAAKNVERFRVCRAMVARAAERDESGPDTLGAELTHLATAALEAMCHDLNTSVALAHALEGTGVIFREGPSMTAASATAALVFLDEVDALLGIAPSEGVRGAPRSAVVEATAEPSVEGRPLSVWIDERANAKRTKDFARADAIRSTLDAAGYELRDTPEGTEWRAKGAL